MSLAMKLFPQLEANWTRVHSFKVSPVTTINTSHENIIKLCRLVFFFLESWCCNSIECTPRIFDYAYSNWDNQWRRSFLHLYITQWFSLAHMVDLCQARSNWQEDRQAHFWAWNGWVVELFTFDLSSEPRKWVGTRNIQTIQVQNCNVHIPHLQCSCKTVKNNK